MSAPAFAQHTWIEAPGGVAAGSISNSPITFGLKPEEQIRLVEVFSQQLAVSSEARARAEARAAEVGAQWDFTREAVIGFFRILGERDVPLDQVPVKLGEIATRHRTLLDQWSAFDMANPATAALASSARAAIDAGHYDEADRLLLLAREQETLAARQAEQLARDAQRVAGLRWLRAAETEGRRGNLAMMRLRYEEAAQHYASAAHLIPEGHPDQRRSYLWDEAAAFYRQGQDRGDNAAATWAVHRVHALVSMTDRKVIPLDWAAAQNIFGIVSSTLGERESGTTRLDEAVVAYRASLEERTRERVPLEWAATQNNLGNVLTSLGERESETTRLEEAAAALRAALEEWTRERVPLEWAMAQNNLGNVLLRLGERESGTARLDEAVVAYRAALEERTHERVPLGWAMAQNSLGNVLLRLGERESGTARLDEAVMAYRSALREWARERVPLEWAATQHNLGNVLLTLGNRESGTANIEVAVMAYRAALEERTRARVPRDWAGTQFNLGDALWRLGERENSTARLNEAVAAWEEILGPIAPTWLGPWLQDVQSHVEKGREEIARRISIARSPDGDTVFEQAGQQR